jgi:hypothetical protein
MFYIDERKRSTPENYLFANNFQLKIILKSKIMKTIKLMLMAGVAFTLYSCDANVNEVISADDLSALQVMETSYLAAAEANTSLANYTTTTGITNDETCIAFDNDYHKNDSTFEANHMMYSHSNNNDNHDKGDWSMGSGWMNGGTNHGNGGMMGGNNGMMGFESGFCSTNNLDLMDSLMTAHEDYHPGN